MKTIQGLCAWALVSLGAVTSSFAADFSFTGNFATDIDVQLFNFTVASNNTSVTLVTRGYAGGTNAAGTSIPRGGFDPILTLFSPTGAFIVSDDDQSSVVDPVSGNSWDALITRLLDTGTYTLALTQYNNSAIGPNLSNGFTGAVINPGFVDANGFQRTSAWAVDILNVSQASIPSTAGVPDSASTAALLLLSLAAVAGLRRNAR